MSSNTKTPAEIVREYVESHIADAGNALDPYFLKAHSTANRVRQRPGGILGALNLPDGMAEQLGITEDKLEEHAEESITLTAISELMADLMHFCKARNLNFGEVARVSVDRFREEMEYANDVLLYGKDVPPNFYRSQDEAPSDL